MAISAPIEFSTCSIKYLGHKPYMYRKENGWGRDTTTDKRRPTTDGLPKPNSLGRVVLNMAVDRTAEFHAAVSSISSRASKSPAETRRLLSSNYDRDDRAVRTTPKSEFSRMAAKIGHDINSTGAKLQRLAQCTQPFLNYFLIFSGQTKDVVRRQVY